VAPENSVVTRALTIAAIKNVAVDVNTNADPSTFAADDAVAADGSTSTEPPNVVAVSNGIVAIDRGTSAEPPTVVTVSDEAIAAEAPTPLFSQGDVDRARDAEPEDKDSLKDRIMGESGSVASEDEQSSKKGSTVSNGSDASEDEESSKKGDAMEDVMQPVSRHQLIPRKAKQSVCYKEASKNKVECVNDSDGSSFVAPEDDMNSKECPRSKASLTSHLCSRGQ